MFACLVRKKRIIFHKRKHFNTNNIICSSFLRSCLYKQLKLCQLVVSYVFSRLIFFRLHQQVPHNAGCIHTADLTQTQPFKSDLVLYRIELNLAVLVVRNWNLIVCQFAPLKLEVHPLYSVCYFSLSPLIILSSSSGSCSYFSQVLERLSFFLPPSTTPLMPLTIHSSFLRSFMILKLRSNLFRLSPILSYGFLPFYVYSTHLSLSFVCLHGNYSPNTSLSLLSSFLLCVIYLWLFQFLCTRFLRSYSYLPLIFRSLFHYYTRP